MSRRGPHGIARRAVWNLVDQGLSSLSNALVTVLVARTLSPTGFGRFAIAFSTAMLMISVVREIVHQPFLLESSAFAPARLRAAGQEAAGAALVIGALFGLLMVLAAVVVRGPAGLALLAGGLTLPMPFVQDLLRFQAQAAGRPVDAAVSDGAWLVMVAASLAVLIEAGVRSPWAYVLAWGLSAGLSAVLAAVRARVLPRPAGALRWTWRRRRTSTWLLLETAAAYGSMQVVLLIVAAVIGATAAGAWRGTQTLLGPVNILSMAALSFLIPEVVRRPALSATGRVRAAATLSGLLLLANVGWSTVLLLLPSAVGHQVLGATWTGARTYLPALAIWSASVALSLGPISVLQAIQHMRAAARVSLVLSPIMLTAGLVGLLLFGGLGAAYGVALAQLVIVPVWWRVLRRSVGPADGGPDADALALAART